MKLLMFHCKVFWYKVGRPGLEGALCSESNEAKYNNCSVVFIHIEPKDVSKSNKVIRKAINNVTWYKRKTGASTIILHSFAHLAEEKADAVDAKKILDAIYTKLKNKIEEVHITPYGCFLEFRMHVFPTPISRVFKSL